MTATEVDVPEGVLHGIEVLDLTWGIAGPMATMLLSDHGARVTRIEPPGGEDAGAVQSEETSIVTQPATACAEAILNTLTWTRPFKCR